MAKTVASAPAARVGNCTAYLSVRPKRHVGFEIRYGGTSRGWSPPGYLRITAVLLVNGHRADSASDTTRFGGRVAAFGRTDYRRFVRSATVLVRAYGPVGSVSCRESRR
jgi:hypothetical protein